MKQLLQNVRNGALTLEQVPAPAPVFGRVIVRNHYSLVSSGTERASMKFARRGMLAKARSRPDLLKQVINKARTDGLAATYRTVNARLDSLQALGYSSAGIVLEVGEGSGEIRPGDMVACAGAGYASHAEIISVPHTLVSPLGEGVSARHGAFGTLGAIAIHGIRRAELTPGESVAVIGLGLLGQVTVQILQAYGFPVFGLDVDRTRVEQARALGLEASAVIGRDDCKALVDEFSGGYGADAVIITAATSGDEPVELAAELLRDRGRVSVVGVVGMNIPRRTYFDKELDVRVSRSYGPGRYDPSYEEHGLDYPISYVRWTEGRNMQEFLRLVGLGLIDLEQIISDVVPFERATDAYDIVGGKNGGGAYLGVLLEYPQTDAPPDRRIDLAPRRKSTSDRVEVGVIGAGMFAVGTLLPVIASTDGLHIKALATATGTNARRIAEKYECDYATTDYTQIIEDADIDAVVIATRHHLHAEMVVSALKAGKHVFVEKPLALDRSGLRSILEALTNATGILSVGFNRRFAPHAISAAKHLSGTSGPLMMNARIVADDVPANHWVHDPVEGGGRIRGEVCHFVDLLQFFAGSAPVTVSATGLRPSGTSVLPEDNTAATVRFANGSTGVITYTSQGATGMSKERYELMGDGRSAVIDNFRTLELFDGAKRNSNKSRQDKGHKALIARFAGAILRGEDPPESTSDLLLNSLATLNIVESMTSGQTVNVTLSDLTDDNAVE